MNALLNSRLLHLNPQPARASNRTQSVDLSQLAAITHARASRSVRVRSTDSGQQPSQDSKTAAKADKLEKLLAQEGIELVTSKTTAQTLGFQNVDVDWGRYHVQILFIDRTDTLRARIAAGIFDRIAEWNGYGRAMYTWSCGLEAEGHAPSVPLPAPPPRANVAAVHALNEAFRASPAEGSSSGSGAQGTSDDVASCTRSSSTTSSSSTSDSVKAAAQCTTPERTEEDDGGTLSVDTRTAAVLSHAAALKIPPRSITRQPERFELDDLDRYDLTICLDRSVRDDILAKVDPQYRSYYEEKVCLLTSFSHYEGDGTLLAVGGFALLPLQLSFLLKPGLARVRGAVDVPRPQLDGAGAEEEWMDMVQTLILSTAGLAKFLMDAMPDETWMDQEL